jgi:hypothetical protein
MAKHIHLHLTTKTADAGKFDESKHKRDHGKFSSTGGSKGGGKAPAKVAPAAIKPTSGSQVKPGSWT